MLNSPVIFISCVFLIACTRLAVSLLNSALKERLLLLEEGITRDKFKVLPQKSTLNNIMEFMDCPVCLTFPESTPIYQCRSNGLCSVCLPNLETCPVCRCTNGFTRCLLAEKILSQRIRVTPKVTNKFLSLLQVQTPLYRQHCPLLSFTPWFISSMVRDLMNLLNSVKNWFD